eukprot:4657739-Pleurochrysis_carterae.AAC.1
MLPRPATLPSTPSPPQSLSEDIDRICTKEKGKVQSLEYHARRWRVAQDMPERTTADYEIADDVNPN